MPIVMAILSSKWFWLALILGALALQTHRVGTAKAETASVVASFAAYTRQDQVEHDRAVAAAKQATLEAIQRAKEADDANAKRYADLDALYARYRMQVRSGGAATASLVPAASGPGVDPRLCYTRDTLDREITSAVGRLRGGIADDAIAYDRASVTAKTCRDWALGLR